MLRKAVPPLCSHDRDASLLSRLLKILWPASKQPVEIREYDSFIDSFVLLTISSSGKKNKCHKISSFVAAAHEQA